MMQQVPMLSDCPRTSFAVVAYFLILSAPIVADTTGKAHLDQVATTYASKKSIQVEAAAQTMILVSGELKLVEIRTTFAQQGENSMVRTIGPSELEVLLVSTREGVIEHRSWRNEYSVTPGAKLHSVFSPSAGRGLGEMVYSTINLNIKDARVVRHDNLMLNGQTVKCLVVLVKYAGRRSDDDSTFLFWIDPGTHLVLKRVYEDEQTTVISTVTKVLLDTELPKSMFTFEPPAGAREVASPGSPIL